MVKVLILIAAVVVVVPAQAQPDCSLRKDSNGIKVYSCVDPDSKFKSIKATFILDANLNEFVAVIQDVPSYKEWQYHMVNTKLIGKGKNEIIYYGEITAPWPVSNRDLIVKLTFNYNSIAKTLVVDGIGLPSSLSEKKDIVRIPSFKAKWRVQQKGDGQLNVEYELVLDIGGSIPAWLANMAQAEGPFETFSKLKTRVPLEQYQGKEYPFLK